MLALFPTRVPEQFLAHRPIFTVCDWMTNTLEGGLHQGYGLLVGLLGFRLDQRRQCTGYQRTRSVQVELLCKKRSLLRKKGGYVLVGDRVQVISIDWQDGRALVSTVLPRTTETANPRVANVDHFALVFSVAEPEFEAFQVTRFLVAAESAGIQCSLLLNKCDLIQHHEVQMIIDLVNGWGYSAIPLSVHSGDGLAEARLSMIHAMQGQSASVHRQALYGNTSCNNVSMHGHAVVHCR